MSGWFACHRTDEARELQERYPFAFLLLFQIAQRAKWKPCGITGLDVNQAFVGDYKKAGIPSEMAYRHAKKVLESNGLATFKGTNKGTVATIEDQRVFSICMEEGTSKTTGQQRTNNGQGTTNNKDIRKEGNKSRGSLEELKEFCKSIGLHESDGEFMFYKWEESGWKNSGKPVKDWRAGIMKWKSKGWIPSQKVQQLFTSKDSQNYGI